MRTRSRIAAVLCAAAFAAAALAATYTWTGDVNGNWDNAGNWDGNGLEGYPDDPNDDAELPASANEYSMNLVDEEIDDLTILRSYYFGASSGSPVLEVDSLLINAAQSEAAIVITISAAEIKTHPGE